MPQYQVWKSEGFEFFDVPGIFDFLVKEGIAQDVSWKNDSSPSFFIPDNDNNEEGIRIWVQHPLRSFREVDDDKGRFIVEEGALDGSNIKKSFETDDLEEALSRVLELLAGEFYEEAVGDLKWFDGDDIPVSLQDLWASYTKRGK